MDFSIVIPTFNRPERLRSCLNSITSQKFEGQYEIIIVDDGSDVDLEPIINDFNNFKSLVYLRQENSGPAKARNYGAEKSNGNMIAFLDDDCQVDSKWLEQLKTAGNNNTIVGGETINHYKDNLYSEASQLLIGHLYRFFKNTNQYFFTSNNFAVPRQTFFSLGGFDTDFHTSAGEDREFCVRALNKGVKLEHVPKAIVYHYHYLNLKQFCKMHFKYGKSAPLFAQKIKNMGVNLTIAEYQFYTILVQHLYANITNIPRRRKMLVILTLSQLMNRFGNLWGLISLKLNPIKRIH